MSCLCLQVHACRKHNSGAIYAVKCMNKRLIKQKKALTNVLEERNVLTMMNSRFVTNLKSEHNLHTYRRISSSYPSV